MFDIVIRGGKTVTPQGVGAYDIAIKGEVIAAVTAPGAIPDSSANRVIDASDKIVMPGGIDPHVHCAWHMPLPDGTAMISAPPEDVSRAALWGGTTRRWCCSRRCLRSGSGCWRPMTRTSPSQ